MAVMDMDQAFFCCLYGNMEDEVIIREIKRDTAYEEEMIYNPIRKSVIDGAK